MMMKMTDSVVIVVVYYYDCYEDDFVAVEAVEVQDVL